MRLRAVFAIWGGAWMAFCQAPAGAPGSNPAFDAVEVRVSPPGLATISMMQVAPIEEGRYQVRSATVPDLIRLAYGVDPEMVVGGPNWLDMDRFDVMARVPASTTPETVKPMLQRVLAERLGLRFHNDTRTIGAYSLTAGEKPKIAASVRPGPSGCQPGPGENGTVRYVCRNMSMAAFAEALRKTAGLPLGTKAVVNETGLKGAWDFEFSYAAGFMMPGAGPQPARVNIFEALDGQLGLKLEEKQLPVQAIVVDSVNEIPAPNPPGARPVFAPLPDKFEFAVIKATAPGGPFINPIEPGGRLTIHASNLRALVSSAVEARPDQLSGIPDWADDAWFEITAKAATDGRAMDMQAYAPMLRSLLIDRFLLAWHEEEQPLEAYSLVAVSPKMKKADPASRTSCRIGMAAAAAMPSIEMVCRNVTMAQFAEQLRYKDRDLMLPTADATGLAGGWDFTLTYGIGQPEGAEPDGRVTIFEAVEKQLGLKLAKSRRSLPMVVIDHLEKEPTPN